MASARQVRDDLRARFRDRPGFRGIATAWDDAGRRVVRIDIDADADIASYKGLPERQDGVEVVVHRVSGYATLETG